MKSPTVPPAACLKASFSAFRMLPARSDSGPWSGRLEKTVSVLPGTVAALVAAARADRRRENGKQQGDHQSLGEGSPLKGGRRAILT